MSQPPLYRAVPVAIPVSPGPFARPRPRPPLVRRPDPPPATLRQRIPWCAVLVGASTVWTMALVVVACLAGPGDAPAVPQTPPPVALAQFAAPAPVAAVEAPPAVVPAPPVADEPEVPPLPPIADGPALGLVILKQKEGPEPAPAPAGVKPIAPEEKPATCAANLGTRIPFVKDPPEAFQLARKERKLVLMIHLSGNFEEKEFT